MSLVDMHCHVDLFRKPMEIVAQAEANAIYTLAMTNTPSVFDATLKLTQASKFVRAAAGLHPELIESHGKELDLIWPLLEKTRYVGEIGLDYTSASNSLRQLQRTIFSRILERCADYKNKIISIHSRRATSDVISLIGENYPGLIILHWFSGTDRQLQKGLESGYYFSVNSRMVHSETGRRLVKQIPLNRVLTESDAPFVVGRNGDVGPYTVADTLKTLAAIWEMDIQKASEVVMKNFKRLLKEGQ